MVDFNIALSGLNAAQKAMDTIGNNIANAATDGYHRQQIEFRPSYSSQKGSALIGGGVDVHSVSRIIDNLLEQEMLRQGSSFGQVSQEATTLGTIESAFGELSTEGGGLNEAINTFFNSLQSLSNEPTNFTSQNKVVVDAEAMSEQFRNLGLFLNDLENQIRLETENTIDSVNTLVSQIGQLNSEIESVESSGGHVNSLSDQRDQCITELSKLIGIQTFSKENGVVDVSVGGIPLVISAVVTELEVGVDENNNIGISIKNASNLTTDIQGGKIGGLLSLKNDIVTGIHSDLNLLAETIIQQINQYHVQAVGSEGSFTSLTGWTNVSGDLKDFANVASGSIFVRVTNTSTGVIRRTEIPVNSNTDSLEDIADAISNITGLTASVNSSNQLTITAAANYKFDFLPAVNPSPTASTLTGTVPDITASGIYTGSINDTFTFTVSNPSGSVGVGNGTLQLIVKNKAGDTVDTIDVGSGYPPLDEITVGQTGIKIKLGTGVLNNGETFKVDVFANTDTSGVLAAAGINTFFSGSNASDIAVNSSIVDNPKLVATSIGPGMDDNENAARMADVKNKAISSLNSFTCGEFYRQMVTDIGQQLSVKQIRQENLDALMQNFLKQQSDISGVDINDEAAQLLIYEQMFQASAKYLNTINSSIQSLFELL